MNYEMHTLPDGNCGCGHCQTPSSEGRKKESENDQRGAASGDAASEKAERKCRECGTKVGKSKQYCDKCRAERNKESHRKSKKKSRISTGNPWANPASWMNFKKDECGSITEKICTCCNKWLPISVFRKRKDTPSGVMCWCRDCASLKVSESRQKKKSLVDFSIVHHLNCEVCGSVFLSSRIKKICSKECSRLKRRKLEREKNNSIQVATEAKCRRCGQTKPLEQFSKDGKTKLFGCLPTACNDCKNQSRRKHQNNPKNKPQRNLYKRINEMLKRTRRGKSKSLSRVLGCSPDMLRRHLQSQFKKGMDWKNYGTKWHVDHIVPVSSFNHHDENQVARCWHFTNLRPLGATENIKKSNTIIACQPELLLQLVDNKQ